MMIGSDSSLFFEAEAEDEVLIFLLPARPAPATSSSWEECAGGAPRLRRRRGRAAVADAGTGEDVDGSWSSVFAPCNAEATRLPVRSALRFRFGGSPDRACGCGCGCA